MSKKPIALPNLGRGIAESNRTKDIKTAAKKIALGKPEIDRRFEITITKTVTIPKENTKSSLKEWNDTIQGHIQNKMPLLSLDKVKLPTIEEVFAVFQEHQNKLGIAFRNNKWGEIPAIEAETKAKLAELGLDIYIDFTPDEEKKVWDEKVKKLAE